MTRVKSHICLDNPCSICRPLGLNRHMAVQLRFDRESFDALKELLREKSFNNLGRTASEESASARRDREALKRIFDQIRNLQYSDR